MTVIYLLERGYFKYYLSFNIYHILVYNDFLLHYADKVHLLNKKKKF